VKRGVITFRGNRHRRAAPNLQVARRRHAWLDSARPASPVCLPRVHAPHEMTREASGAHGQRRAADAPGTGPAGRGLAVRLPALGDGKSPAIPVALYYGGK
jgi:hypothetical protein